MMQRWIFLMILMSLFAIPLTVAAQDEPVGSGAICALAYEDTNQNGRRDSGEMPLPGISVNLADANSVIFSTTISTDSTDVYCFENLAPATYQLIFADSANHRSTTENSIDLPLSEGEQVRVDFGALPQDPFLLEEEAALLDQQQAEDNRLSTTTRVLLALAGAVIVMIFMVGFGALIVSVIY